MNKNSVTILNIENKSLINNFIKAMYMNLTKFYLK